MDRKPVSSTKHICELYSGIVHTILLVVANPLVGLDPVLKDRKLSSRGIFMTIEGSFQDHDARATMGTHCCCPRDLRGGGKFRSKT